MLIFFTTYIDCFEKICVYAHINMHKTIQIPTIIHYITFTFTFTFTLHYIHKYT